MTTCVPPSFLASEAFSARRSRACALPPLNLKKQRDCLQSRYNPDEVGLSQTRKVGLW